MMSLSEIAHRATERKRVRMLLRNPSPMGKQGTLRSEFALARERQLPSLQFDIAAMSRDVDALLHGEMKVLAWDWKFEDNDADVWRRAPDSGRLWPEDPFPLIDYRQNNDIGDARVVWEPARLQILLALAKYANVDSRALLLIEKLIRSFARHNPAYLGVHYVSAMECALRVLALSFTMDMLRGFEVSSNLWKPVLILVAEHASLIENRLSLYSSLGNHTIAEATGLICAARVLQGQESQLVVDRWRNTGQRLLQQELCRQVRTDGGPLEQSNAYLRQILDLGQLGVGLSSPDWREAATLHPVLHRGYRFLQQFQDEQWRRFGDADDGHVLSKYWCGLSQWLGQANTFADAVRFQASGYSVWRGELEVMLDHGDLGMAPGFGHGHADALSLTLADREGCWLIDPGTYTYTGDECWRTYFRSTRAHNTLCLANRDQAVQLGPFLWSEAYRSRQLASWQIQDWDCTLAVHDGYLSLGVLHWRAVAVQSQQLVVWDGVFGAADVLGHLHWHLAPEVSVMGDRLRRADGAELLFSVEGAVSFEIFKGSLRPRLGWCAPGYGNLQPTQSLRCGIGKEQRMLRSTFTSALRLPQVSHLEASVLAQVSGLLPEVS